MKLAYFTVELPYPPRHGGRVDTWSRMKAMHAAGADIFLVSWYTPADHPLPSDTLDTLNAVTVQHRFFLTKPDLQDRLLRLIRLIRWPSHVSARVPLSFNLRAYWQQMDAFKPDAVWLDGLYGTVLAQACAKRYGIPLFYRSHNIEHRYMASQVARTSQWKQRLLWAMNLPHLKRVETQTIRAAHTSFDISMDDMQWWKNQGIRHVQWLPPTMQQETATRLSAPRTTPPAFDVAYLGNLRTPNNVEGVLWFLQQVWPQVKSLHPPATMVLAGSSPVDSIRQAATAAPGVTLLENAPDATAVWRDARVLVNPVFSGSGVNIKSVEMLFTPAVRISTTQGVAGLPQHVQQCFHVTDQAQAFAQTIAAALQGATPDTSVSNSAALEKARSEFDQVRIEQVLQHMKHVNHSRAHHRQA